MKLEKRSFAQGDASVPNPMGRQPRRAVAEILGETGSAVAFTFAISIAIQCVNVLTGVLLARALGPHGRGEFAAIILWPTILTAVGSMGIFEAATYYTARAASSVGTVTGTVVTISLALSAALVGLGFGILPLVLRGYGPHALEIAQLTLMYIPLGLTTLVILAIINGLQRFFAFQLMRLLLALLTGAGLLVLFLAHNLRPATAVVTYLGANVIILIASAAVLVRAETVRLGFNLALARHVLGFGIKSHTSNVSGLLNERLDQMIISIFLAPVKLGLYVVAVTLTSLTSLVGSSVSMVALPAIARLHGDGERRNAARRFLVITTVTSTVVTVPLVAFTPEFIQVFFGASFLDATNVARVLLVAGILLSTNRTLASILKAVGKPLDAGIAETVALVVTFAALAALLPTLGIVGAGVASLLAYAVSTGWMVRRAVRVLDISWNTLLLPTRGDVSVGVRAALAFLQEAKR